MEVIAFVADGEVHSGTIEGGFEPVPSRFADRYQATSEAQAARNAWKREDRGAGLLSAQDLWGGAPEGGPARPLATHVATGLEPRTLIYGMRAGPIQSLFQNRWATGFDPEEEVRLNSYRDRELTDLSPDPSKARFACTVQGRSEGSAIAVMDAEGREVIEVTGGDAEDSAPCWHPSRENTVVYQSSGLARGPEGELLGHGPAHLLALEVKTQRMETVQEDDKLDFVAPRFDPSGDLYCIRRPYRRPDERPSLAASLTDAAAAPLRIGEAVFGWLDFFSRRYSGRSLNEKSEEEQVRLHRALARRRGAGGAARPIRPPADKEDAWRVPAEWELIRWSKGAGAKAVASRVLDFAFLADGRLVHTDGLGLYVSEGGRNPEVFAEHPRIGRITILRP